MQQQLKEAGIPTVVHYSISLNRQPTVADEAACLPIGDRVANEAMSLPMHPYLDEASQQTIIKALSASFSV
ncbi:DegT/DnrJ/EryC1/StrS family aminotransferase [Pseudomonas sp. Pc102]|uniref:DegT/DnrJ/EryC1/StrS family aminotransferase n=1 Tax=Pseudomonas sp. Pc102 TaxID=2678261 RepID=UPI0024681335|nr:DegT/DnrJ/EryC1/StrS family aminotransferase [Pseudomonas sp. Pc102]